MICRLDNVSCMKYAIAEINISCLYIIYLQKCQLSACVLDSHKVVTTHTCESIIGVVYLCTCVLRMQTFGISTLVRSRMADFWFCNTNVQHLIACLCYRFAHMVSKPTSHMWHMMCIDHQVGVLGK